VLCWLDLHWFAQHKELSCHLRIDPCSPIRAASVAAVLCAVAFMDFVDASITNVALPHIRVALGFSVQTLQWVPSAYLLTYGGLMLLGGRLADLFGRRRMISSGPRSSPPDRSLAAC